MATALTTSWNSDDRTITLRHEDQTFNESTGSMDIEHLGEITLTESEWTQAVTAIIRATASHEPVGD